MWKQVIYWMKCVIQIFLASCGVDDTFLNPGSCSCVYKWQSVCVYQSQHVAEQITAEGCYWTQALFKCHFLAGLRELFFFFFGPSTPSLFQVLRGLTPGARRNRILLSPCSRRAVPHNQNGRARVSGPPRRLHGVTGGDRLAGTSPGRLQQKPGQVSTSCVSLSKLWFPKMKQLERFPLSLKCR